MKLNRLLFSSVLILSSMMALGYTFDKPEHQEFNFGETNELGFEKVKVSKASDNTLEETILGVGPAACQKKEESDGTSTLRFVAPVKVKGFTQDKGYLELVPGADFGFNVKYDYKGNTFEGNLPISDYFISIQTPSKIYYANEYSKYATSENSPISDYYQDTVSEDIDLEYNAFITKEIRNIPSDFSSYIEVKPYFIEEGSTQETYAKYSKKANLNTNSYYSALVNGQEYELKNEEVVDELHSRFYLELPALGKYDEVLIGGSNAKEVEGHKGTYYADIDTPKALEVSFKEYQEDKIYTSYFTDVEPGLETKIEEPYVLTSNYEVGHIYNLKVGPQNLSEVREGEEANYKFYHPTLTTKPNHLMKKLDNLYLKTPTLNFYEEVSVYDSYSRVIKNTTKPLEEGQEQNVYKALGRGEYIIRYNFDHKAVIQEPNINYTIKVGNQVTPLALTSSGYEANIPYVSDDQEINFYINDEKLTLVTPDTEAQSNLANDVAPYKTHNKALNSKVTLKRNDNNHIFYLSGYDEYNYYEVDSKVAWLEEDGGRVILKGFDAKGKTEYVEGTVEGSKASFKSKTKFVKGELYRVCHSAVINNSIPKTHIFNETKTFEFKDQEESISAFASVNMNPQKRVNYLIVLTDPNPLQYCTFGQEIEFSAGGGYVLTADTAYEEVEHFVYRFRVFYPEGEHINYFNLAGRAPSVGILARSPNIVPTIDGICFTVLIR